jgi:hypothetical protein
VPAIAMVSAKGSPGVTVSAAALVAVANGRSESEEGATLVEFDPAGGDLEVLVGAHTGEPSLLHAATEVRRDAGPEALAAHVGEPLPGLPAVLAPVTSHAADTVIESVREAVTVGLVAAGGWVVVDAGRWEPSQRSSGRIGGAEVVAVVCRSTAASIAHARDLVLPLRTAAPSSTVVVLQVGHDPYPPSETAEVVDAPVLGPLSWDPRGVTALWAAGPTPRWRARSSLAASAGRLLDQLAALDDVSSETRLETIDPTREEEPA